MPEIEKEIMKMIEEIVDMTLYLCKRDTLTKDGYQVLLAMTDKIPKNAQRNFILLCIAKGYPKDTGQSVMRILGIEREE